MNDTTLYSYLEQVQLYNSVKTIKVLKKFKK